MNTRTDREVAVDAEAVTVRPRRIRRYVVPVAALVFAAFLFAGVRLRASYTGVNFTVGDQAAVIGIGVLLALGFLLALWPRVRADETAVYVRNLGGTRTVPWSAVRAVSFPDGARWARLELDADEYLAMFAVQAADGERTVTAMRALRALHRAARD